MLYTAVLGSLSLIDWAITMLPSASTTSPINMTFVGSSSLVGSFCKYTIIVCAAIPLSFFMAGSSIVTCPV